MSDIFGSIINTLGGALKGNPLGALLAGAGLFSQMSLAAKEKQALDRSLYYAKHPEAISAIAAKLQQPLSTGLTQGVENVVNASMAEQGLSQAPGIQSQVLAQALAPYQQQEQQTAMNAALAAIGLPSEALKNLSSMANPSQLASLLKLILPSGTSQGSSPLPGTISDVGLNLPDVAYPSLPGLDVPNLPPVVGTPPISDSGIPV